MNRSRFILFVSCGLLLLLTACDEPSMVGIDLIEEGSEPTVRILAPSMLEDVALRDITGIDIGLGTTGRFLTGAVDDPMIGTISATGYVDYLGSIDSTGNPTIHGVMLRLVPNYVYGDTVTAVTMNVMDLTENWIAVGARADTTLITGDFVTSFTFSPVDTLADVLLPESWVAANDTTLRSSLFSTLFPGFAIEPVGGNAVVGFDMTQSFLRVFTSKDTTDIFMSKSITHLERDTQALVPEGRILVQDGSGPTVKFDFNFEDESLNDSSINGAAIRFFADTLTLGSTPANFVRPPINTLQLVRVDENEDAFLVSTASLDERGHYRFSAPPITGTPLVTLVQNIFFGEKDFEHFELRIPITSNTINVMLLHDDSVEETTPEALLTLSSPSQ